MLKLLLLAGVFHPRTAGAADSPFNNEKAQETVRSFERAYFRSYSSGLSRFYGRFWANTFARKTMYRDTDRTVWQHFVKELADRGKRPKRLDCTLYAQEALRAGMAPEDYRRLREEHRALWKARGFAGWSVAYLLTEKFNWKAYAIIDRSARYFGTYLHHFTAKKEYPVWKQPNIKIERHYLLGRDDRAIERLLGKHRFGWGFSDGGVHTWITSRTKLKECHWDCGPSKKYDIPSTHAYYQTSNVREHTLFKTTRLVDFTDYQVHLVVFPPAASKRR